MTAGELDFAGLGASLLRDSRMLVPAWLPGGTMRGREYVCSGLKGGNGSSLSVNMDTGKWADFAGDSKGGDLISLYAAIEGLHQGEAARRLAADMRYPLVTERQAAPTPPAKPQTPPGPQIVAPPDDAAPPTMRHSQFGDPAARWCYRDSNAAPLFWIARYNQEEGKKQFVPWSWNGHENRWVMKSWPAPRPLYGLDRLAADKEQPVMIVEGEKACDAARQITTVYAVITWPGGAKATGKIDLSPLIGRKLLLWGDADEPGRQAMRDLAHLLEDSCPEIKIVDTEGMPDGWDAADALEGGWAWEQFSAWAKPRLKVHSKAPSQIIPPSAPPSEPEDEANVPTSLQAAWEKLGIPLTQQGAPICNIDSALRVIEGWPAFKDLAWFDVFHQKILTCWKSEVPREWSDINDLELVAFMQRTLGLRRMGDDVIHKAIRIYANARRRNEPKDWMETLAWDGTPRIERFLIDCLGADDNVYTKAASSNFWIGLAARTFHPGVKLDNMIILEGGQGKFKSTALELVGGAWYAEAQGAAVTSKDFFMILRGKLLIEIGEMASFNKGEIAAVKQVVTCKTDRYRAPYGRSAEDHPRMSVFVGSTNEREYLRDNTGARRFWPVQCGMIDRQKIVADRPQLYAEAVARFKKGETWYEMPLEATLAEQESRRQIDEWEPVIEEFLVGKTEVSTAEIAGHLRIEVSRLGMIESRRIANVLRALEWDRITVRRGSRTIKVWVDKKAPALPMVEEQAPF